VGTFGVGLSIDEKIKKNPINELTNPFLNIDYRPMKCVNASNCGKGYEGKK
jgi:hypothetical protein